MYLIRMRRPYVYISMYICMCVRSWPSTCLCWWWCRPRAAKYWSGCWMRTRWGHWIWYKLSWPRPALSGHSLMHTCIHTYIHNRYIIWKHKSIFNRYISTYINTYAYVLAQYECRPHGRKGSGRLSCPRVPPITCSRVDRSLQRFILTYIHTYIVHIHIHKHTCSLKTFNMIIPGVQELFASSNINDVSSPGIIHTFT